MARHTGLERMTVQGTGEGPACLGAIADYAEGAEGGEDEDEKHGLDERLVAFQRNECYCRCHPKLAKGKVGVTH